MTFKKSEESVAKLSSVDHKAVEKLDAIQRIMTLLDIDEGVPAELFSQYKNQEDFLGDEFVDSEYAHKRALGFLAGQKICQAIKEFEPVLNKYPFSLTVQCTWRHVLSTVEAKFLSLAATDPFNPEIGPAYFTMRRLGLNLEDAHIMVLRHFVRTGQWELARALAVNLFVVSPNIMGLRNLAQEVVGEVDSPEIEKALADQPAVYNLKMRKRSLNFETGYFLQQEFAKVSELYDEMRYGECLELCRNIIPKEGDFELAYIEFYLREACCLDSLGNPNAALEKFFKINQAAPNWIVAHRSMKIVLARVADKAVSDYGEDPSVAAVSAIYNLVASISMVPRPLTLLYIRGLAKKGKQNAKVIKLLKALGNLYPCDGQIINEILYLGYQIKSQDLIDLGNQRLEEVYAARPWDLRVRATLQVKTAA